MSKKIMAVMCALFIFAGGVFLPVIESLAVNYEYYVGYSQPACNENSGYFSVISTANEGSLYTYFWTFTGNRNTTNTSPSAEMYINVTSSRSVTFEPCVYGDNGTAYLTFGYFDQVGTLHMLHYGLVGWKTYSRTEEFSYDIAGFIYGGNATGFQYGYRDVPTPIIHWNESPDGVQLNNKMNDILTRLANLDSDGDHIINRLENIYNQNVVIQQKLDNMNTLLNQIKAEQEETNTWLEKIYNFFAEKDEKDKEAATQQGNQSTADIDNMIQDDSAGFVDSLGGLTSSMSYTGTNCSWTFPTVKIPAISGVMDEVTLVESQEIDFTYWVNSIPSGILLLVQSVCTVALIVFCFKELYGAISYALTLKGGGNSE